MHVDRSPCPKTIWLPERRRATFSQGRATFWWGPPSLNKNGFCPWERRSHGKSAEHLPLLLASCRKLASDRHPGRWAKKNTPLQAARPLLSYLPLAGNRHLHALGSEVAASLFLG